MSSFQATIEAAPRGGAHVVVPGDVIEALGGGGRIPVVVSFDGVECRGSIVRMGGESVLGLLKTIREGLGKAPGDRLTVTVERDLAGREVDVPPELAAVLAANPAARSVFEELSFSHRREHAQYVAEAKKPETRVRRAQATVDRLIG